MRNRVLRLLAVPVIAVAMAGCEGDEDESSTDSDKNAADARTALLTTSPDPTMAGRR
jgi:hypothetical protein